MNSNFELTDAAIALAIAKESPDVDANLATESQNNEISYRFDLDNTVWRTRFGFWKTDFDKRLKMINYNILP
jgi:hypothetical protein